MILIADSGSTKTDWTLFAAGRMERIHTQGINPMLQDDAAILQVVEGELKGAHSVPQAGSQVLQEGLGCGWADGVEAIYFYGAGCLPEVCGRLAAVLRQAFPQATTVEVESDLLGAARAVCGRGEGMAAILGTGANSCLYDGRAIVRHTPALGFILGDEGSGAVLGRKLVNALFKGTLPASLRDAFVAETHLSMADVIRRVYREPMPNRFLASLSHFVASHLDHEGLAEMVVENFGEFIAKNILPYRRADLPLGVVGSIGYYFRPQLEQACRRQGIMLGTVLQSPMEGLLGYHGLQP